MMKFLIIALSYHTRSEILQLYFRTIHMTVIVKCALRYMINFPLNYKAKYLGYN